MFCFVVIWDVVSVEFDCFVCVISFYGMEGKVSIVYFEVKKLFIRIEYFIYIRDGVVRINEFLELFNDWNCWYFKGKLKMFFI